MAKRRNGFDASALKKYAEQLEAAGGTAGVKQAVGRGMKATKLKANPKIDAAIQKPNLPAGGKYSTGGTAAHLNKDFTVYWEGNVACMKLGFNLDGDGLTSIFLMYGTPRHRPAPGLREAIREEPRKISRKEMAKACKTILEMLGG